MLHCGVYFLNNVYKIKVSSRLSKQKAKYIWMIRVAIFYKYLKNRQG